MNFAGLSSVVVFRVLRAGKRDIESQMGLARIMKELTAHSSAQTGSHRNDMGGGDGCERGGRVRKRDVCVGVFVRRVLETGLYPP